MALSVNTVWEVRNGGSDTNGGGFVTGSGGTDYSQQNSPQLSVSDAACTGNTTVTSATGGFTAAMVGNIISITPVFSATGWYQITGWTDTNTITIDRNGPNASGMTANVGGALATPGMMSGLSADGHIAFLKYHATPYSASSTAGSGGKLYYVSGAQFYGHTLIGYDTTRTVGNRDANRPTIKATSTATYSLIDADPYINHHIYNVILDGDSRTGVTGASRWAGYGWLTCYCVKVINCPAVGLAGEWFNDCEASGCGYGLVQATMIGCVAHGCSSHGFLRGRFQNCLSYGNGGCGFAMNEAVAMNCTAYNNGSDGFGYNFDNVGGMACLNCLAVGNGGYGFSNTNGTPNYVYFNSLINCYTLGNTSGAIGGFTGKDAILIGNVALSADPFTNAGAGDFSLNNTAGGGAVCRAAAFPGVFPGGLTTGYLDIGAVQHQDSGGGGGSGPVARPVIIQNIGTY